jgi:hypothetical protein
VGGTEQGSDCSQRRAALSYRHDLLPSRSSNAGLGSLEPTSAPRSCRDHCWWSGCCYLLLFGLYGLVESTFCISRPAGTLEVRRRLFYLTFVKAYSVNHVSHVFERHTGKGNGLRMQLPSGKKKGLTLFTEYMSLEAQVAAMNHFIHSTRHYQSRGSSTVEKPHHG